MLEEYIGLYNTWRDRAFKAANIGDWIEAAKCFKETAFYNCLIEHIKRTNDTDSNSGRKLG